MLQGPGHATEMGFSKGEGKILSLAVITQAPAWPMAEEMGNSSTESDWGVWVDESSEVHRGRVRCSGNRF